MNTQAKTEDRTAYEQLSRRLRAFVDHIVSGMTQADAARETSYGKTRPDVAGSKLMRRPLVRKAVEQRRLQAAEEAGVETSAILLRIAAIAKNPTAKDSDRLRADELLGKYRGMWVEKHEHTGKDGAPLPTAAPAAAPVILMTPEAAKAIAQQLSAEV